VKGVHVRIVALLFVGLSALGLLGAVISSILFGVLANAVAASEPFDRRPFGLTGLALSGALALLALPPLVAGIGLLRARPWARVLGILVGAALLVYFPYGTIVGLYALWALFRVPAPASKVS
jgi:hypothetical protein